MSAEGRIVLVAESGSTKTDWCLTDGGPLRLCWKTGGMNPFYQTTDEMEALLRRELLPCLDGKRPTQVSFYGAGCATKERNQRVVRAVQAVWGPIPVRVESDLVAAARSLCGNRPGIACILGTGSNSCYYDGRQVQKNVPPLGFILGDEGSGASLGKRLVADCLKGQLPPGVVEAFWAYVGLSYAELLDRVYCRPFPNRFLAGLAPFLSAHLDHAEVVQRVEEEFRLFLRRNVRQYDWAHHAVHFTGSVAYHFETVLRRVAQAEGFRVGVVSASPLEGLIDWEFQSNT